MHTNSNIKQTYYKITNQEEKSLWISISGRLKHSG